MKANVFKPILTFFLGCLFFFSASAGILPEGYYTIRLASSGKHLDVHSGAIEANSTPFHLWSKANNLSQTFKLEEIQGGVYLIKAAGSNKAMDASWNQRNQNGCPVIIWDKNKGETQGWKIRRISGDKYAITLNSNGKALSGSISNYTQNAGKVQLWTQMAQYKNLQEWVIEPLKKVIRSSKYVDLRANQSPYKHQKLNVANDRGSCTYFATLAALEAAYLKKGRRNLDLSEEAWSIYAKMLGIHPFWADNTHANWRENQFARTQGGGSIKLLAAGVRVPQERYARYIAEHGDIDWGNRNQKICNDFNFRTLTPAIQNAPLSYGVKSYRELSSRSAPEIEGILRQGYEIVMGINKGGHVLLFVGYDKTDPNNKRFIVKNSYVAPKSNGQWVESWELVDYLSYDELPDLRGGAYIVDVHDPAPWKEAKILGRWNFDYDGWKGTLDIHHLPGLMNTFFDDTEAVRRNGKAILDHRLGTYYDRNGKAFRVNGKIIKNGASS
ncbi:MAG: RICIN domain-containing protein, partial [Bacteroidota bacterium]